MFFSPALRSRFLLTFALVWARLLLRHEFCRLSCPFSFVDFRLFGSPYFRLDMKCHHVGNRRPVGPPFFRLDMKCHLFGNCRLFGSPSFRLAVFSALLGSHHVGNCWLFCCASRLLCNSFHGSFAMHFVALSPCTVATLPCTVANQQCTMVLLTCTLVTCCAWAGVTYLIW